MPLYEHVFIARQDISTSQAEALLEHFTKVLEDNGGKVVGTEYWGLKNLAYKIQKNRKGHYAFMRTDSPAEAVKEMERLMRIHDDVMRVLTIKVEEHEEGQSAMLANKGRDDRDRGRGPRGDRGDRDRGPRGDRGGDRGDRGGDRGDRAPRGDRGGDRGDRGGDRPRAETRS